MRSLVIEDDQITGQVMKEILLSFGECDHAEDGKSGLDNFLSACEDNNRYDVIFLDIMMPDLTGQQVLEKIREIEEKLGINGLDMTKVVMSTALDDMNNIKLAFRNQAEGYIVKPIHKDTIVKTLLELELI